MSDGNEIIVTANESPLSALVANGPMPQITTHDGSYGPPIPTFTKEQAEEVMRFAVEDARAEILGCLQSVRSWLTAYDPQDDEQIPPATAIWGWLNRLLWLLGLPEQEVAFIRAAAQESAEPGACFDGLLVFADWLEDQMRPEHAERIRRITPSPGDVLVIRYDQRRAHPADVRVAAEKAAARITEALGSIGRTVSWIGLPHDWDLEHVTPPMLLRSGLVLRRDYEALVDRLGRAEGEAARLKTELESIRAEACRPPHDT